MSVPEISLPSSEPERRVLVLAPFGRDEDAAAAVLGAAGFDVHCCADVEQLCAEIDRGAAAAVLTEEAISEDGRRRVSEVLARQPAWSDLPLLVMISHDHEERDGWLALEAIEGTAHLALLERPLHVATLVSAARSAVLSRAKQYQVRDELAARKEAEERLRQSETRYRELVQNASSAILRWSRDGTLTFINEYAQAFFGYRAEEVVGRRVDIFLPERDRTGDSPDGLIDEIARHPDRYASHANENVCRDGRRVWMAWTNRPIFDETGRVKEILAVGTDITERKRAEDELELQASVVSGINRIFRRALKTSSGARLGEVCLAVAKDVTQSPIGFVATLNSAGSLLEPLAISNPGWAACAFGHGQGENRLTFQVRGVFGRVVLDRKSFFTNDPASHPDCVGLPPDHPPLEAFLGVPLFRGGQVTGMVAVGNRAGGYGPEQLASLESLAPAMVEAFTRQEVERALRENREDLARAQAVGQIGSWRLDVRRNELTWSDENYRIFGVPKGTPLSYERFLETVHPEDRGYVDQCWKAALHGKPYDLQHRLIVDGRPRWVRQKAYLEFDDDGQLRGGFGITQDITERKEVEAELERLNETLEEQVAERTAVAERRARDLRRLAAELSEAEHRERERLARLLHDDLQQLLLAGKLRLPVLALRKDPAQVQEDVARLDELLSDCITSSRNLTRELSPPILRRGTLKDVMEWLGDWFGEKYRLAVTVKSRKRLPAVPSHLRVFLFHAVRELLLNVVKHSGEMIATVSVTGQGGRLVVEVEDAGDGFDPATMENTLERPESFGLFNIRERLEALLGRMEVEVARCGGARFRLIVPLGDEAVVPEAEPVVPEKDDVGDGPERPRGATLRLLVVDDHQVVREGLVGVLGQEPGLEVVGEAADGEEALRQAETLRPDVITMDVDMPNVDGVEATRQIKIRYPEIVVVGLSLHEGSAVSQAMIEAGADAHLSKHSSADEITEAIRLACRRKLTPR